MKSVRPAGEKIRNFIIANVQKHPGDIAAVTARKFGITRQAVARHIRTLVEGGFLHATGSTRARSYALKTLHKDVQFLEVKPDMSEDEVWNDFSGAVDSLPQNVIEIWQHGFTEMFNNVIDHSNARLARVSIRQDAALTRIVIDDNGVGIFKKIQDALGLADERHAVLELAKGKFTTDPSRHSGEGIFFSSRMFDAFAIYSGSVIFSHDMGDDFDMISETQQLGKGTMVFMELRNHTSRTVKKIFDKFSSGEDYAFNKTVVPIRMAEYGDDKLVSRSQARRVLARIEKFTDVIFEFDDVASIGQAFADEIFRVFANKHPGIQVGFVGANSAVKRMILRARSAEA